MRRATALLAALAASVALAATATTIAPGQSVTISCAVPGAPPPPPPPPQPPAPPPTTGCKPGPHVAVELGWTSAPKELRLASGAVAALRIPAPNGAKASVRLSQGQVAVSPGGYTEFTVSRCPGVIDPSAGSCYRKVDSGNWALAPDAYTRAVGSLNSQAALDSRNSCWAPAGEGPWYVNVRWTYPAGTPCPYGCGYSMQWFPGSY